MEAKKQAGRSPAAFFAEWPLSDPAMRPLIKESASVIAGLTFYKRHGENNFSVLFIVA